MNEQNGKLGDGPNLGGKVLPLIGGYREFNKLPPKEIGEAVFDESVRFITRAQKAKEMFPQAKEYNRRIDLYMNDACNALHMFATAETYHHSAQREVADLIKRLDQGMIFPPSIRLQVYLALTERAINEIVGQWAVAHGVERPIAFDAILELSLASWNRAKQATTSEGSTEAPEVKPEG